MSYTLGELAQLSGSKLIGDPAVWITDVGSLDDAGTGQISFLTSRRFEIHLPTTGASAVILSPKYATNCPTNALVNDNPTLAYAVIATALTQTERPEPGIHPSAVIDATADIDPSARIEPHCTIGADVRIGPDAVIGPNCVIADECAIGRGSHLVASVTLGRRTCLGERCLVHPGAVLGADGFGLANDDGRWVKIPQLGRVMLGNDVEVGACTTIDRGALKDTVLHDGVKLDNLVHLAHNVEIGDSTAIAAQTGIAGSTRVGAWCTLAGQAGLSGHLEVSNGVHISGQTAITRSLHEPGIYTSTVPALPHAEWRKNFVRIRQLDELSRRIKALEKALQAEGRDQRAEDQNN